MWPGLILVVYISFDRQKDLNFIFINPYTFGMLNVHVNVKFLHFFHLVTTKYVFPIKNSAAFQDEKIEIVDEKISFLSED